MVHRREKDYWIDELRNNGDDIRSRIDHNLKVVSYFDSFIKGSPVSHSIP